MLPVYRTSEGVENLGINYQTFEDCKNIFKKNGIVLIFSEAKCVNEWHLRPLRKGTARLAFSSWDEDIPLEVLPVGINYSSFRKFSKNVFINFGEEITKHDFDLDHADGKRNQSFNNKLTGQFHQLVFEIDKNDIQKQKQLLKIKPSSLTKMFLLIPAIIGFLINTPLYLPIKKLTYKGTWDNDHYDSVLMALLLFIYPLYVIFVTIIVFILTHNLFSWLLIIFFPFSAWAYSRLKPQLDKQIAKTSSS